ncbi:acyltransferase [Segetibacter aerophilus]|uniref:Maltose O-acetyltransferase n=1 Tax=Segetibacter aerophilus TaxID=670293 RepID=A0A512BDD2_9BACT|nr:acyltransferase [Segetibacter aerophilus]GEO09905.1 maltose O-acetyltransferase [Segetibacter aerophilus]
MINKAINFILNKIITPRKRYSGCLVSANSSIFLSNFSITNFKNNKVKIGEECVLGANIIFEEKDGIVEFGDRVYVGSSKIICKNKIVFENDILVAWGVTFYDHNSHSLDYRDRQKDIRQVFADFKSSGGNYLRNKNWTNVASSPIIIKSNAWIGMDALILKGVTIGEGAVVAARSVVTKDVLPFTVVAGNPAKVIKTLRIE